MIRPITEPFEVSQEGYRPWTLEETCDKLKRHLQEWYKRRKKRGQIEPVEMSHERQRFMDRNPDAREHDFDIWTDFEIVPGSYKPGCFCGDCDWRDRAVCRGVVVEPYDWQAMNKYAK